MNWLDIAVPLALFFSFFGGFKDGAVKALFSLLALVIAIPFAGRYYYLLADLLSFLPGSDWQNFIGFYVALAVISLIVQLALWIPRKLAGTLWREGIFFRLVGGVASTVSAGIGLVLFAAVINSYPIFGWLLGLVKSSEVIAWLIASLGFVLGLLPYGFYRGGGVFTRAL